MDELICGFPVLPFPKKPVYLPITDEQFRQETLSAWCRGREEERITAAIRGGEREWALLYQDGNFLVRGAVMCKASEDIQLNMLHEPEPVVRKLLAKYGTDRVRAALLAEGENHPTVLVEIVRYGNSKVKNRILPMAWDKPEVLKEIAPHLGTRGLRILEKHPDTQVRFAAAMHGNRKQCRRFLDSIKGNQDFQYWGMEDALIERISELDQIEKALLDGRGKTLKFTEMER